jgi:hypothetical protein
MWPRRAKADEAKVKDTRKEDKWMKYTCGKGELKRMKRRSRTPERRING